MFTFQTEDRPSHLLLMLQQEARRKGTAKEEMVIAQIQSMGRGQTIS